MAVKLFDDHEPRCEYCTHVRREGEKYICACKRTKAAKPCSAFDYDPLKRVPRQEARLPEYRPEDFSIDCEDETAVPEVWQADQDGRDWK